jgi:hypothetical protein
LCLPRTLSIFRDRTYRSVKDGSPCKGDLCAVVRCVRFSQALTACPALISFLDIEIFYSVEREMVEMRRERLVVLNVMVVAVAVAVVASSASAATISFVWSVDGHQLRSGSETKEFDVSSDGKTFDISGTLGGAAALLLATEVSVEKGAHIIGGIPGTNEERAVFKGVTVDRPGGCAVKGGQVATVAMKSEIVEGAKEKAGNGEVDILFTPREGETFTEFEFENKGTENCNLTILGKISVTGSILLLGLPQKTEVLRGELDSEAATKEYRNFKNEFKTAELKVGGGAARVTGLTLRLLISDEKLGAF